MLAPGHGLCLPVLPSEAPGVPGDAASGPEVGRPVCGHQPQKVLGLLLGVELVSDLQSKKPAANEKVGGIVRKCGELGVVVGRTTPGTSQVAGCQGSSNDMPVLKS